MYKEYAYETNQCNCAHGYLLPCVRAMLGAPPRRVLDLGCGNGEMAQTLLADGHDVYGLDASHSGIAIANQRAPGRFFVQDLSTGDVPDVLADKRFDVVISTEVIEHLYDPRALLRLVRRVVGAGGELVVSTPYHGYLKNVALALTGELDAHMTVLWDGGHIKFFSRKTLEAMLLQEGFEVDAFAGAGRLPFFWKSMVMKAKVV
jgi:2-polyprenyl-3-methyl-5-hydroxy-6-metoxy-1,4-benzoquinol methylase